MRKTKKMLALALASALMVTSVQVNWDVTAYAAVQEGAETNGSRQVVSNAITWNMDYLISEGKCSEISDQNIPTNKIEYSESKYGERYPSINYDENVVQFDTDVLGQILGVNADQLQNLTWNNLTYNFQWSKAGDDGVFTDITSAIKSRHF